MENKDIDFIILSFFIKDFKYLIDTIAKIDDVFFDQPYRTVYTSFKEYFKKHKLLPSKEVAIQNMQSLSQDAAHVKIIDELYGYISTYQDGDFPFFIERIKARFNNQLVKSSLAYMDTLYSNGTSIEIINKHIDKLAAEIHLINKVSVFRQGSIGQSAKERWEEYLDRKNNPEKAKGILSGYPDLDMHTNGLKDSELMVISGPSGTGKSILMMNMAINAWMGSNTPDTDPAQWKDDGKNILYVTIEMPKEDIEMRMDSNIAGLSLYHLRDGKCTADEESIYEKALAYQEKYDGKKKFWVLDIARDTTVGNLEAQYQSLLPIFEPDLIVVDYIGIMKPSNPTGIDWLDQGSIAAELHEFCRTYRKPIITGAQMNKAQATGNGKQSFDVERLARSKMIGDNANVVIQIEKGPNFDTSSYLRIHLVKNRKGESGKAIDLIKEYWRMRITNPHGDFNIDPNAI